MSDMDWQDRMDAQGLALEADRMLADADRAAQNARYSDAAPSAAGTVYAAVTTALDGVAQDAGSGEWQAWQSHAGGLSAAWFRTEAEAVAKLAAWRAARPTAQAVCA